MLEKIFRSVFKSNQIEQNETRTQVMKNRILKLTNRIEQQMSDYDMLLNGIDTMIWLTYDPEKQGKANQAFLDFFGKTNEEIEGKPLREILSKETAEICIQNNKKIFENGNPITTYEWVIRKDGVKRLLKINKRAKKNGVHYIVASAEDITELEETKLELEQECDFNTKLIETAQALILVLDVDANIVRCNNYFERVTGYDLSELVGKNWFDFFIKDSDKERVKKVFDFYLNNVSQANAVTTGTINPIKTKEGKEVLIEWFSQPLTNNLNAAIGVMSIGQDISGRKLMEEELWSKLIETEHKLKMATMLKEGDILEEYKGTETLLIVDDEVTVRDVLSSFLENYGYTIIKAKDSKEAISIIENPDIEFDLMISDLYLEKVDGKELSSLLKEKRPEIKTLLISGVYPSNDITISSDLFFQKPFKLDEFIKKVRGILDS